MTEDTVTLQQIHRDLLALSQEVKQIRTGIDDLRDVESKVRPEYLRKIKEIEKGKFLSREELEKELED